MVASTHPRSCMVPMADEMTVPVDTGAPVVLPVVEPTPAVAGILRTDNGGYFYVGGDDRKLVSDPWPVDYPRENDANQGIILDAQDVVDIPVMNDYEGPNAKYQNGGATQRRVPMCGPSGNPVDEISYPWTGTGPSPYQVDTNVIGPVSGRSEGMNGTTSQPDRTLDGQYGAATGGGTANHETATAYNWARVDQVQRDYAASALFASV